MCTNIRNTLATIGYTERYSGFRQGILKASVGDATKVLPTSRLLEVGKKALYLAKQQKYSWENAGEYLRLFVKVQIRRSKKPVSFKENVLQWLMDHTRPSSNSKNVIKWKDEDKQVSNHIVQWREESLAKMFQRCKLELHYGQMLHRTYFYHLIPPFIKKLRPMEGLCPYHMSHRSWGKELARKREQWHCTRKEDQYCACTCRFCSSDGCNHGKNPDGGVCAEMSCVRCRYVTCPVEWTEDWKTVWYTTSLQKREGGGMHWVDDKHTGTRQKMMRNWLKEMDAFEEHNNRVEWIKNKVLWLKNNLPHGHILIKADFIQNISHSRAAESSSAYYNKRQTQLLVFVVWYHAEESTEENPVIKKKYYDYLSGFLKHTSLFFQKCFTHLLEYLCNDLPQNFTKVNFCM